MAKDEPGVSEFISGKASSSRTAHQRPFIVSMSRRQQNWREWIGQRTVLLCAEDMPLLQESWDKETYCPQNRAPANAVTTESSKEEESSRVGQVRKAQLSRLLFCAQWPLEMPGVKLCDGSTCLRCFSPLPSPSWVWEGIQRTVQRTSLGNKMHMQVGQRSYRQLSEYSTLGCHWAQESKWAFCIRKFLAIGGQIHISFLNFQ